MAVLSALPFFHFFLLAHCYSHRRPARKLCFETYGFVAYLELAAHRTCSLRNTPRSPIHPFRLFFANQFGYKWKRGRNRWDETFARNERTERKSTLSSGEVLIKNFSRSFSKDESLPVGREYSAIFCTAYSLRRGCITAGNCDFIIQCTQRATPFLVYLRTVPLWLWIHAIPYSLSAAMNAIDLSSDNLPSTSERRWNKEFREFRFTPRSSSIVVFYALNDYDRSHPTISPCTRERRRNCTKHEHDV